MSIEGATGVLYNVVGSDLTLTEISLVSELIKEAVDPSANIKFGAQIDPNAGDELTITIVATGFDENKQVFTKKQKGVDENVRTFGFKPRAEEVKPEPEIDTEEDDVLESFEKENLPEEDIEEEKILPSLPKNNYEDGDDPLDVPAFMRRSK